MTDAHQLASFHHRFAYMLLCAGIDRKTFAKQPGIGQQNVTNWMRRGRIGASSYRIVHKITGVSAEWVNDGIGEPPKLLLTKAAHPMSMPQSEISADDTRSYVRFEHPNVFTGVKDMEYKDYPDLIRAIEVRDDQALIMAGKPQNGAIRIVTIATDTMVPTLNPKDLVFIDTDVKEFQGDGIYFFQYDGSLLCKRLQKVQRGKIAVISDNPSYAQWTIDADDPTDWQVIARVLSTVPLQVRHLA